MRHKILWLWVWITMTLWLGNITGCSTVPQAEQDPELRTQAMVDAWARHWTPPCESSIDTPSRCGPMAAGDGCDQCQGETACVRHQTPILTPSINRSHWPKIQVESHGGQTRHGPIYFQDCPVHPREPDLARTAGTEAGIHAVLSGDRAVGYSRTNLQSMLTQPVKAAFDLIALPVRMVMDPPWTTNTTP